MRLDGKYHDRNSFDCGVVALNRFLQQQASQGDKKDHTRTFILAATKDSAKIVGFYTLSMIDIDMTRLPAKLRKKHQTARSAGLVARLAVGKEYHGQRIGEWLLVDSLLRLVRASEEVGFPLVVVDSKQGAKEFYLKYGFQPFDSEPAKLFVTVADLRLTFAGIL